MKKVFSEIVNKYLFAAGLVIVLLSGIPYLLLGENAVFPYHDQLDGELIAYIYQAKYLFDGQGIVPEFLNGASKTALIPPAPLGVLLFKVLSPFAALLLMQVFGQVVAYIGMFRLAEQMTEKKLIAFVVGMLYAYIPFLAVYGLAQYGAPLMLLSIYYIYKEKYVKRSLVYVAFYASMSSLVLCGFAWLGIWAVVILVLAFGRRLKEHKSFVVGFTVLLSMYVVENLTLLGQMLGIGVDSVSHKSDYVLTGGGLLATFWNYFTHNVQHSEDNHLWIGCLAVVVLLLVLLFKNKWETKALRQCRCLLGVLGIICVFCVLAAVWDCSWGAAVREHLGALGAFQINRVLWLAPVLWMLVLALCLDILWRARAYGKWLAYGGSFLMLGCAAVVTLKNSLVKPNLQNLLWPNYNITSYANYLAVGIMEQVEVCIEEKEGLTKEEYKVASLGINPAAALYHGFYCVDGYSNNYDLEYKYAFREVIAPELERNEYIKGYYDNWGNRCYLFSSEYPGNYMMQKDCFEYKDLQLDTEALKALGCDYILSAAYISNAEEIKLTLLNEEAFETAGSYYEIYVYKIW